MSFYVVWLLFFFLSFPPVWWHSHRKWPSHKYFLQTKRARLWFTTQRRPFGAFTSLHNKVLRKLTPTKQSERECSIQAAHTSQGRRHLRSGPYSQTVAYSAGDLVPNENVFAVLYLSACLEHWAMLHSEDVAVLKSSVPRILVSKTQDMQKKLQLQSATPSAAPSSALSPSATPNLRMEAESVKDK